MREKQEGNLGREWKAVAVERRKEKTICCLDWIGLELRKRANEATNWLPNKFQVRIPKKFLLKLKLELELKSNLSSNFRELCKAFSTNSKEKRS